MQKKYFLLFSIIFIITSPALSQFSIRRTIVPPVPVDSLDIAYYSKNKGWLATSQVMGLNIGLWAFDKYALNAPYAQIDMHSIRQNLKKGFVWDNDQISTNMFMHPYHGSLYYNSARSNGFNFWESGAFALGGSAMWELFMENEYPSANDIIATPIGGAALGEVFYSASDMILDDRARGKERIGRELAAFLITPTQGLTRLITGDAWRKRSTPGRQYGIPDMFLEVSVGNRVLELKGSDLIEKALGFTTNINVEYGDRFATENIKPYDYFSFRSNLIMQRQQPLLAQINIIGQMHVGELLDTEKDFISLGVYQHFDYYDSDTISKSNIPYKLGIPASIGIGAIYKNKRFKNFNFDAALHLNAILLGSSLSDHYNVDNRNYNMGSGFSTKLALNFSYKDKIGLSLIQENYRVFTWKGYPKDVDWKLIDEHEFNYQGDKSEASFHVSSLRADLKLKNQLYLTGIFTNYARDTNYKYYDDVFSLSFDAQILLTYKF